MIKYDLNTINDWNFGDDNIIKVYRNNAVCYYKITGGGDTPTYDVCYAVVDDITQYHETEFIDVYDKATEKWYKLNNLNQYEEYGIYGSGRNITYYKGKLTVDNGYEYEWNGSSWVNVGEVSGSTATLPDVPFVLNYNAKNYDASTHTIAQTTGQLNGNDAVAYNNPSNIVDHSADGYITISNSSMRIRKTGQDISLFNRTNSSTGAALTIVCKAKSTGGENIITNRDNNYNWMYRLKTGGLLTFHGTSETGGIYWNKSNPDIMSVRTYYDSGTKLYYNNWTQNTSTSPISFTYGSTNADSGTAGALFVGYGWNQTSEQWSGDFYWVYMSQNRLTDAQIQEVIDYNEDGGGQTEYPVYYDEKADPLNNLTFNRMEDAVDYAYNNCVYDGMKATIDGERYYFDSSDENGWVEYSGTIWLDPSATNALFSIGHYWGENYKMVITTYLSGSYGGDYDSFWQYHDHTPIELSFYSNGFYYDMHDPTSTTAPNVRTSDYSSRILQTGIFSNYQNSQVMVLTLTYGSFKAELADSGTLIYSNGNTKTGYSWYSGLYQANIGLNNANAKCHLSHIQIYNGNNELVNDFKFIKNNGVVGSQEISIYDSVTNTTYNNTNSNTPVYHIET